LRRKVIGLGIFMFVLFGLWSAGWFYASGMLREQVLALAQNDGESAPRVTCGTLDVGGFPFRFDLTCLGAEMVDADRTVTLGGLTASVRVYAPTHAIITAQSPLGFDNAFTGSRSRIDFASFEGSARFTSGDLGAALQGEGWRIGRVSGLADGVQWFDTIATDLLQASAAHLELHLIDIEEAHDDAAGTAALAIYAKADDLTAPAYGIANGNGAIEAELSGLPDDLRVLAADTDPLRNWQARGGVLKVVSLKGAQPVPDQLVEGSGEFSLTPEGFITANLNYRTKDVFPRFAGLMEAWQLALLQGKPEDDGSFSNSFALVDGKLQLLTFTLLETPPLF
jgi:hypothetical protein